KWATMSTEVVDYLIRSGRLSTSLPVPSVETTQLRPVLVGGKRPKDKPARELSQVRGPYEGPDTLAIRQLVAHILFGVSPPKDEGTSDSKGRLDHAVELLHLVLSYRRELVDSTVW